METIKEERSSRGRSFVSFVLDRMKTDTAFRAALRRADNPATEYQSWEILSAWCDLEKDCDRRPFTVVAAALARSKPEKDGPWGIGPAIAACYEKRNEDDAARSKLRRLLACSTVEEACNILRPLLSLIASRGGKVSYADLLDQLLYFNEKTRLRWAAEFYGKRVES